MAWEGSEGAGHVGWWRMRRTESFRTHFMFVLNHGQFNMYFKSRIFQTQRQVIHGKPVFINYRRGPILQPLLLYKNIRFWWTRHFSFLKLNLKVINICLSVLSLTICTPKGPVDDLECTEASPDLADTRRPSHQSELPQCELHNTLECDALFQLVAWHDRLIDTVWGWVVMTQAPLCVPRTRGSPAGCDGNRGRQSS